jgi:hypothetical protein
MSTTIQLIAPAPYFAIMSRQGTQYVADANALITGIIQQWDIIDLLNAGCVHAEIAPNFQFDSAAGHPAATGNDVVMAVATLPANFLTRDGVGVELAMFGTFANNTNVKTAKIIVGPTTAVIGSTVGTGGTALATTGAYSTTGQAGFSLGAQFTKLGVLGANTQNGFETQVIIGSVHSGMGIPQALTLVETAPILIAFTANAATTASDITLNYASVTPLD